MTAKNDHITAVFTGQRWCRDGTAKQIRTAAGISQTELGDMLGVKGETISRYENGERIPKGPRAAKLFHLLVALRDDAQ